MRPFLFLVRASFFYISPLYSEKVGENEVSGVRFLFSIMDERLFISLYGEKLGEKELETK